RAETGALFMVSSRRRHTSSRRDWSSDVCSSDLSIFLFMVVYAGIMLFLGWRHMDEPLPEHRKQELRPSVIFRNYGLLLSHRGFMLYALAGAFGSAGMFAYISGSPRVFIQTFGVDPSIFGFIFG